MAQGFMKYREKGAYHWALTYPENFRRSSPRAHALYDVTLDLVSRRLNSSLRGLLGADIGCGDGVLVYKAIRQGARVIGVDMDSIGLTLGAKEIRRRAGVIAAMVNASCYDLPFANEAFHFVICTELIEHLASEKNFLRECVRLLRPGGIFICTTPRKLSPGADVQDAYHVREYAPETLYELLSEVLYDVEVLGIFPNWLDWIYKDEHLRLIELVARFGIKLLSFFWNPYRYIVRRGGEDLSRCACLVGIGYKGF
jgi:2-polyprenyl-3-methyl-5-hydroxy-6-metoxy-1,4-benzoquinol methylase